jgi:hypothetical protein
MFPNITKFKKFPAKLAEFIPFIFIRTQYCPTVKQILLNWLGLPNKLGLLLQEILLL